MVRAVSSKAWQIRRRHRQGTVVRRSQSDSNTFTEGHEDQQMCTVKKLSSCFVWFGDINIILKVPNGRRQPTTIYRRN